MATNCLSLIQIEVLKYTDELESGVRQRPKGLSMQQSIEGFRQSLLKKVRFVFYQTFVR